MGIEVLPPDINESDSDFAVVEDRIRFGLSAVKNVGLAMIAAVTEERRENGPFKSVFDFCRRVDSTKVNKKALESLIKCGAFDSTGAPRKGMLEVLPQAMAMGQQSQKDSLSGQGSIFDLGEVEAHEDHDPAIPEDEFGSAELSLFEKETMGIFISSHPLFGLEETIRSQGALDTEALQEVADRSTVTVVGMVAGVKKLTTKKGDPMAFVSIQDLVELYQKSRDLLVEDNVVMVKGRADQKGMDDQGRREVKIIATEISAFDREIGGDSGTHTHTVQLNIDLGELECRPELLGSMKELCRNYPGGVPVVVQMATSDGVRRFRLGSEYRVVPDPEFVSGMQGLFGEQSVNVIASPLTA
jgi:DNA polymerase-3 subunit alpha